jgi:hypothetical protein
MKAIDEVLDHPKISVDSKRTIKQMAGDPKKKRGRPKKTQK